MSFKVETPVFAGPFDLLLHLILKEEVELYEVSLSPIVDAYLAELERLETTDLEVATEFLLIAATLVELKCRRLLPARDRFDLDDELGLWEERDLLLARLIECKTFKDAAQVLRRLSADAGLSYPRTAGLDEAFIGLTPDLLEGTKPEALRRAFMKATAPKPEPYVDLFHVNPITITVADAVTELLDELPRSPRMTFRELTASLVDRIEIVVRFLAILELYKQDLIELEQLDTFGDITVVWQGEGRQHDLTFDDYEG